jgi:NitT/TauT family transport system permease protein
MSETRFPAIVAARTLPNRWDIVAGLCVLGVLVAVAHAARGTLAPLSAPDASAVSLDPIYLPYYALRTTLRMFGALVASLLFTLTYATVAAKSRRAGQLMIPVLDILQSVPILGFLSFTVVFFMSLVPGRVLGAELAALFAIFTSQAFNMAFSMYQSLTTIPGDLDEATRGFRLTVWQRFWRLEVPFAMPGLVWNTMMSMSGGWFFVVAAEVYAGGSISYVLPGIGSYVSLALDRRDIVAVVWAILTMLVVIVAYDQLLFRPLVAWSGKFRFETTAANDGPDPWMLALLRRTRLLRIAGDIMSAGLTAAGGMRLSGGTRREHQSAPPILHRLGDIAWYAGLTVAVAAACWRVASFAAQTLHWSDLGVAVGLGLLTLLRVLVLMVLASLVWVPVGVWLGLRPHWARRAQPVAQFLAAFPANLLFPPFVLLIVRYHLNADVWLTPLMMLGTQWYILFNVIAGAAAFPGDLREAAANFRLRGWLWWVRVIIPGILPYYVTGAITASGGSWNAAIVSEVASWGSTHLVAHGLGAYIAEATSRGDAGRIVLGIAVMSVFVLTVNRLLWRPLYAFAARRMVLS